MQKKACAHEAPHFVRRGENTPIASRRDARIRPFHLSREITLTYLGIAVTIAATFLLTKDVLSIALSHLLAADYGKTVEQGIFLGIVIFLIYGYLVYQLARMGYLKRLTCHHPASQEELNRIFEKPVPPLTMLIPSYKEETGVVRQALLSAAALPISAIAWHARKVAPAASRLLTTHRQVKMCRPFVLFFVSC